VRRIYPGAILALFLVIVYLYVSNRDTTESFQQNVLLLESKLAMVNDECETRIAIVKAGSAVLTECPEPVDGKTFAEFMNSLPPEFSEKLSADITKSLTFGACVSFWDKAGGKYGRLRDKAERRKRIRLNNALLPPEQTAHDYDTTAEPAAE
jgi:hypothetical protein